MITCVKLRPWRVAVSNSCALKRNPPSPDTDTTCVPGRTIVAAIAHGSATPRVCWPSENSSRRG